MTISKTRLKQIIKEELLSEAFSPVDGSGLKGAGDELKASIGQIASTLDGAGEECGQLVVLALGDGIEFMVVAAGTAYGESKKGASDSVDLVIDHIMWVIVKHPTEG